MKSRNGEGLPIFKRSAQYLFQRCSALARAPDPNLAWVLTGSGTPMAERGKPQPCPTLGESNTALALKWGGCGAGGIGGGEGGGAVRL